MIIPNTKIFLLNVPIEIDNKNQLTFPNRTAQTQYFQSLTSSEEMINATYQRKERTIRFDKKIDDLLEFNYVMYQNTNYSDKWFYAFITNMRYSNNNVTEISFEIDSFQTWQFDIEYKQSFVEREMMSKAQDIPGANLVPENVETGEVIENASTEVNGLNPYYIIAYGRNPRTDNYPNTDDVADGGSFVNGIPSGLWFCVCSKDELLNILAMINGAGHGDSVLSVFTVPSVAILDLEGYDNSAILSGQAVVYKWISELGSNGREFTLYSTPTTLNGYTPKNAKLRTFPFCYLGFTPTSGTQKIFRYEDFTNGTPTFKMISEINPNPSCFFIPENYRGSNGWNVSESVLINGYPTIAYISDYFSSWLAQNQELLNLNLERLDVNYRYNQESLNIKQMKGFATMMGDAITLNVSGTVGGVFDRRQENETRTNLARNYELDIETQMAQVQSHSLLPNSGNLGSTNTTLLGYDLLNIDIFTRYTIKAQFARRIDNYFSMFGYATNELKVPNINNRSNWNYVKTAGLNITGAIPQEDIQKIKNMFDNGVTLWHNANNFLDYSQNNN